MKKIALLFTALFWVSAFAQDLPANPHDTGLPDTVGVQELPSVADVQELPSAVDVQEPPSAAAVRESPEPPAALELPKPSVAKDLPQPAAGQHKDTVAVYMAGEEPKGAIGSHRILGVELEKAISRSKNYIAVNRTDEILKMLTKEHEYTRSGEVDDAQIKKIGKQFGAQYLCIVEINAANRGYYLAAQLVDVESARIINTSSAGSRMENYNEQMAVAQKIAMELVGDAEGRRTPSAPELAHPSKKTKKPKKPKKPRSYGAGGVFAHNVGGGVDFSHDGEIAMPYTAGGGYLYFDLVYLELAAGFAGGGGKWKSFDTNYPEYLPDMSRTYINYGALLKLPFGAGNVKFFPLVGFDYERSISAELKNGLSSIKKPGNSDLSAMWFKFGGGLDVGLWQNAYLRTEVLYGMRTANAYENAGGNSYGYITESGGNGSSYVSSRSGDGLTFKMGIGLNIVKRQSDAENGNKHKNTEPAASGQKEEK